MKLTLLGPATIQVVINATTPTNSPYTVGQPLSNFGKGVILSNIINVEVVERQIRTPNPCM